MQNMIIEKHDTISEEAMYEFLNYTKQWYDSFHRDPQRKMCAVFLMKN